VRQENKSQISLKTKKVLIVDDFFNFRLTVKNMMRSLGILFIDDAATGEDAIKLMAVRRFDIILCDYNLGPGKNGQQVLEEGKFRGYINSATIFIMLTAENTTEMIMGAIEYKPDDYLMKPFAREVLINRIKNVAAKKLNLRDIETAIAENDFDHALQLCNELLSQRPGNLSEIMKLKGEVLLRKGTYNEAAEFYDNILLMGNVPWAQLGRGRVDFFLGNYDRAKNIFEQIIAQNNKIMTAHDYLAQTLIKMHNPQEAQQVLMNAIKISPRALLRHKNLGSLAYRNEDFATAEASFKNAVDQGRHSCFKNPSDYTHLAKTLVHRDAPQEGLKVLGNALKEFPDSSDTRLHLSVAESYVYTKMNQTDEARRSLATAQKYATELKGDLPGDLALDLAEAYLAAGETQKGTAIIKNIVESNHDNDEVLDNIRAVFKEVGMTEQGESLIETTRDEIIELNNKGVKLAQDGNLIEAITYFEKAATHLPENKIINANAAQVLMLYMKEQGTSEGRLAQAKTYLDRVRKIDESYADIAALLAMYRELSAEE
jgi:tetratricopeptide (TPR) repeat protein